MSEVVDLVYEDFSDSKNEEECNEECIAIAEVLFFRLVNLSRSLKLSLSRLVTMAAIFALEATTMWKESEDTVGCTQKEMEFDTPGKNIWLA